MKNFISKIVTFILSCLIILIFLIGLFFCLDLLEIIDVPEQYSLVNVFYSKLEVIANAESNREVTNETKENNSILISNTADKTNVDSTVVVMPSKVQTIYMHDSESVGKIVDFNRFYYNQLNAYGKTMYDELYGNIDKIKTGHFKIDFGTEFDYLLHQHDGSEILNNSFQEAVNSLLFDHPEIFYVDVTKIFLFTEITSRTFTKTYTVSIGTNSESCLLEEFNDMESFYEALSDIERIKYYILSNAEGSEYEKIKYIHDYLIDNCQYEKYEQSSKLHSIYGILKEKKAVCEGYSKAFKYILDSLNIPNIIVCGTGNDGSGQIESHAWNYVNLNGLWYAIDATWDDPIIIGNGKLTDDLKYTYFLKGSYTFFKDHTEDGAITKNSHFVYPELNETDY